MPWNGAAWGIAAPGIAAPGISEPLEQPVDIFALELRAVALAGAAAQLVEDLPRLLDVGLVAVGVRARAAAGRLAVDVVLPVALTHLVHHLLSHGARRLLQLVERLG